MVKLPGLVDPHVHLRDPGATHKEDFYTGTCAALAGGFVAIVDMPNNPEPTVTEQELERKKQIALEKAVCDFGMHFGASQVDNMGEFGAAFDASVGLKVYMDTTTGSLLVEDEGLLEKMFATWPKEKPLLVHAEGATFEKAVRIAKKTNRRLHLCHMSLASEVRLVRQLKEEGFPITCEVTPHHLFLTDKEARRLGPFGMMKPPLRSRMDVQALWDNLEVIDMVATDHAPHTRKEKEGEKPPFGVPGLETALPLLLTAVTEGRLSLDDIVRLMHTGPTRVFGLRMGPTSFIEVDTDKKWVVQNGKLYTKCNWSPFAGMTLTGYVLRVTIRETVAFEDREVLVPPGFGRPLVGGE